MPSEEVHSSQDIERLQKQVRCSARATHEKLTKLSSEPLEALYRFKFNKFGYRPLDKRCLNLIEQLNQTFTILTTLAAVRHLFKDFLLNGGLRLNLGPTRGWDIESIVGDDLNAEVFAAVKPSNGGKLKKDIDKLYKDSKAKNRYVVFYAHSIQTPGRQCDLEDKYGQRQQGAKVQIWALDKSEIM